MCGALDSEHYMNLLATSVLHKLRAKVSIMIQPSVSFFAPVRIRRKLAKLLIEPFDQTQTGSTSMSFEQVRLTISSDQNGCPK